MASLTAHEDDINLHSVHSILLMHEQRINVQTSITENEVCCTHKYSKPIKKIQQWKTTLSSQTRIIPKMHKTKGETLLDTLKIHTLVEATKILSSYILASNHNANFVAKWVIQ